jgi:hypothetical protein
VYGDGQQSERCGLSAEQASSYEIRSPGWSIDENGAERAFLLPLFKKGTMLSAISNLKHAIAH